MARTALAKGAVMLNAGLADEAARISYIAALNAALIFERASAVSKTHRGTHSRFAELTREDGLDDQIRGFLGKSYEFKTAADYGSNSIESITTQQAEQAIATASRFLSTVERLLAGTEEGKTE